jgi:hypothetical protein
MCLVNRFGDVANVLGRFTLGPNGFGIKLAAVLERKLALGFAHVFHVRFE